MTVPDSSTRRVAIIGAGYISTFHLRAIQRQPGVRVVAVCDIDRGSAAALAVRAGGATAYSNLAEIIADGRPDTAHVLTPANTHASVIRQLLDAGIHVLTEKPLATTSADCRALTAEAARTGCALAVSHNFLFAPPYERLRRDLAQGRLGRLEEIDLVWRKPLPLVRSGPFGGWLFADPRNVLFEVGSHSFAHIADLVGTIDSVEATAADPVELPAGRVFFRQWEVLALSGRSAVRLRFAFGDGYPEHCLCVRGTTGSAMVDFELDSYTRREHWHPLLDVDRFLVATSGAFSAIGQATQTLGRFAAAQLGLHGGGPYTLSIERAVSAFYRAPNTAADVRIRPELATRAVELAERVASAARLGALPTPKPKPVVPTLAPAKSTVLVLGGTGFIGRSLVRKLRESGRGVRVLARDSTASEAFFSQLGVERVRGDVRDARSLEAALDGGIHDVFAMARGYGRTWDDFVRSDLEPTLSLAELCLSRKARLYYASSIAIYGGRPGETIDEHTPPNPGTLRVNLYSRVKAEIERRVLELYRSRGLEVVIFRPGIVLGPGSSPYHGGIGAWPYPSVCQLWGHGQNRLPLVLVDDCADAMLRALDVPNIAGESFNLVGDAILTAHDYLDELERSTQVKIKRLETPPWRSFASEVAKYGIKAVARSSELRWPSYADCLGRSGAARFSGEKAKRILGWRPTDDRAVLVRVGIQLPAEEFLA